MKYLKNKEKEEIVDLLNELSDNGHNVSVLNYFDVEIPKTLDEAFTDKELDLEGFVMVTDEDTQDEQISRFVDFKENVDVLVNEGIIVEVDE